MRKGRWNIYLVQREQLGKVLSHRRLYFWQAAQARTAFWLDCEDLSLISEEENLEATPMRKDCQLEFGGG